MSHASTAPPLSNDPPLVDLYSALEPIALGQFLAERFDRHSRRATELGAAYKRFLLATSTGIQDDGVLARAWDFKEKLRLAVVDCEETRVAIKAPVKAAVDQIDGLGRALNEPLIEAGKEIKRRCDEYANEKDRREREAARLEAEQKEAEFQALLDKTTTPDGEIDHDVLDRAETVAIEAQAAQDKVTAKPAELTRIRTAAGLAPALRDKWEFVGIEDISQVPVHFLMVNKQAVDAAIKKGIHAIPGLIIANNKKMR